MEIAEFTNKTYGNGSEGMFRIIFTSFAFSEFIF